MNDKEKTNIRKKKSSNDISNNLKEFSSPELLRVSQNVSTEDLKRKFPHLHSEIAEDSMKLNIDRIEGQFSPSEGSNDPLDSADPFRDYTPSVIDYLCRARTEEEAKEVINYSFKQGQISKEEEIKLLKQLETEGVRSFGPFRAEGHYFRKAVEMRNREVIRKRYSTPDNK